MKTLYLFGAIALLLFSTSCQEKEPPTEDGKLKVVCTVGMIADLAKVIGGDSVTTHSIIGSGADPHVYKHTAKDIKLLQAADVILYNGFHLEGARRARSLCAHVLTDYSRESTFSRNST